MPATLTSERPHDTSRWPAILAGIIGLFIACVLAKLGNPVIFRSTEQAPTDWAEVLFTTWPTPWGWFMLAAVGLCSLRYFIKPLRPFALPLWWMFCFYGWFLWAGISTSNSVARDLSVLCVNHFGGGLLVFSIGLMVLSRLPNTQPFWLIVAIGFLFVFWIGIDQHNGGLDATRKAFFERPDWEKFPKEYIAKIQSNRIFGPFIYPNTFAGAILLWCPALCVALWDWARRFPSLLQKLLVGLFGFAGAICLFWTGSRAGWLIAIAMTCVGLLHAQLKRATKIGIIVGVVVLGLIGFAIKNRAYFEKGATSATARTIYWKAAVQVANAHPLFGSGQGTFAKTYAPIKPPDAEMARLVHNDYLEQACDSGWPAMVLFTGFVFGAIYLGHRKIGISRLHFMVWLGLLGWALQSFVEFGLYIPAICWSAFLLMGWLLGSRIAIDTPPRKA